jgi:AsmA protein
MDAGLYGGKLVASGTKVDLGQPEPSWTLAAKLDGVDLGAAMTSVLGNAPLTGKTSGSLHLSGNGIEWAKLRNQLTGAAALAIRDGALTTTDLGNQLLGGVSQALRAVGKGGAAEKVGGAGGKTTFKDLAANFAVKDGWMVTEKPFRFDTPVGPVDLGGRVGLDLRVDLSGSAAVPRDVLARIAPPALQGRLPASLAVPLGLGGTLSSPSVQVRADEAVSALVRGQAEQAAKQIRQEAEKKGKSALEDVFKRFSR